MNKWRRRSVPALVRITSSWATSWLRGGVCGNCNPASLEYATGFRARRAASPRMGRGACLRFHRNRDAACPGDAAGGPGHRATGFAGPHAVLGGRRNHHSCGPADRVHRRADPPVEGEAAQLFNAFPISCSTGVALCMRAAGRAAIADHLNHYGLISGNFRTLRSMASDAWCFGMYKRFGGPP